jgi:PAS domain S-box-containing protein
MQQNSAVGQAVDPQGAKQMQEQRQVLGQAARLLGGSSDLGDNLLGALSACLPALADFGYFDVVLADGHVRRTVAAYRDPFLEDLLRATEWTRQGHPRLNLCALTTCEAALHRRVDDAWYREAASSEPHLRQLRELAFGSMITVPMRYRNELVGALTLFMGASGRSHGEADLELAGEVALLAAPVVVNARLVEQHRRSEKALREQAERLRIAVEAGQVGIWEWQIPENRVNWSDRVYEMHGMQLGADTGGLTGFRSRIHPDDRQRVEDALVAALEGGAPYEAEFRTELPGGGIRWISTRSHIVRGADGHALRMIGASTDVTERVELLAAERRARADAEAAQRRLQLLASAGTLLARSLDPDDTLQAVACTIVPMVADWCRIDLLDADGVQQRRLTYHPDPDRAFRATEMALRLRTRSGTEGSMAWCIRTGQPFFGHFDESPSSDDPALREFADTFGLRMHYIVPLVARGRTIGAMGIVQAESGRGFDDDDRSLILELGRRAALAIDNAHAYAEAEAARLQAEKASRAKDEFLAMLGHELRTPLAPIATALELMARRDGEAHVDERQVIGGQVAHLSRLIDDLLDVSRIAQRKVELQRAPVDLRSVVGQAIEQTRPVFRQRSAALELRLPEAPAMVLGDGIRLTQVLCKLLVNASRFTPADGRVGLTVQARDGGVEVIVEDNGSGIAPELLPHVFEIFVQGRQPIDRQGGGLGLGLAIVRMLVEMHGGTVTAASEGEDRGSRFTVWLPAPPSGTVAAAAAEPPERMEGAAMSARILIVDDNADAAETLADLLRIMGYEVRSAGDADAAMAVLDDYVPQLALLDIGLPGQDGYALAKRMRDDARCAGAKLVALTGYGSDRDRAKALGANFDEHLVKPVAAEKLFALVQQMVG